MTHIHASIHDHGMVATLNGTDTSAVPTHRRGDVPPQGTVRTLVRDERFHLLYGIVRTMDGSLFVSGGSRLWRVHNRTVSVVAGSGDQGYVNGVGEVARFACIGYPAFASESTLLIGDLLNHCVRAVDVVTGEVSKFAGQGNDPPGGGGRGSDLYHPYGVLALPDGSFAVSGGNDHTILLISPGGVVIKTLAGRPDREGYGDGGATARFHNPVGMALEPRGTILVADSENHRICRSNPYTGLVSTVAGVCCPPRWEGDLRLRAVPGFLDGSISTAQFAEPSDVAVAKNGTIYVADSRNERVREICLMTNTVSMLAGSGTWQYRTGVSRNGVGDSAAMDHPMGLCLDEANHRLFVTCCNAVCVISVTTSGERRAVRRGPLMCVRAHVHRQAPRTTDIMTDPPLPGSVHEPLVRKALGFMFLDCPALPFSIALRFLVG